MDLKAVRLEIDAHGAAWLGLDLPGKSVNVLTDGMLAELESALDRMAGDSPRGLAIHSKKARSFVAGADLKAIVSLPPPELDRYLKRGQDLFDRIAALPCPTVAVIGGDCLGGGLELALACESRVISDDPTIKIGLPEVTLGLIPCWGATVRLPRLIGTAAAVEMIASGRIVSPQEALRLGIVDAVCASADLPVAVRRCLFEDRRPSSDRSPGDIAAVSTTPSPDRAEIEMLVRIGREKGHAAGLDAERRLILHHLQNPATQQRIAAFFSQHASRKAETPR